VIVSLDADFLYAGFPGNVRYIRDFAKRRNPDGNMNRLYVIESAPTTTGAKADHRLPVKAARSTPCSPWLWSRCFWPERSARYGWRIRGLLRPLPRLDDASQGPRVVIVGDHQPPSVHALAHAINTKLGNVGKTVFYTDPIDANPGQSDRIHQRSRRRHARGKVDLLIILGGNPAYDAPSDLNFADAILKKQSSSSRSLRTLSGRNRRTLPVARQRRRTNSNPGVTLAPTTARSASSSR
jgi:hypothetical protein